MLFFFFSVFFAFAAGTSYLCRHRLSSAVAFGLNPRLKKATAAEGTGRRGRT